MVIGIDPGVSGAVAWLLESGEFYRAVDMPTMKLGKSSRVNAAELSRCLRDFRPSHAVVERVASMPKQGVASTFAFGHSAGVLEGILAALGIPYELVTPQSWKRHFGLLGADKDASRAKAIQLYPDAPLGRKKDVGRADAMLLARYVVERRATQINTRKFVPETLRAKLEHDAWGEPA